jgi:hypothetical protein
MVRRAWCRAIVAALGLLVSSQLHAQLIIGELRLRGPAGATDKFITIPNGTVIPVIRVCRNLISDGSSSTTRTDTMKNL